MLATQAPGAAEVQPASPPLQTSEFAPAPPSAPTPIPDTVILEADAEEQLLINVYQRVNPAVVNIDVSAQRGPVFSHYGTGSGFIVDQEGYVVTNNHVVEEASDILVTLSDGRVAGAQVVGTDPYADLALIELEGPPDGLTAIEWGNSDELLVGQRVIAIGNPFGLSGSMSVGIVSALGRTLPATSSDPEVYVFSNPAIIQTDAAINPGNSGGPLLDSYGRVVGINSAILTEVGFNSGVGFAIPANTIRRSMEQILETGTVSYAYIGISSTRSITLAELAEPLDLPFSEGVLIGEVTPGSPAAVAGLRGNNREIQVRGITVPVGGDIITAVDGVAMAEFDDLLSYLALNTDVGQEVTVTFFRDGEFFDVAVTLAERPR